MTLNVPWSDFAEEVKARVGPSAKVYLSHQDGTTIATSSDPRLSMIVRSATRQPYAEVEADLQKASLNFTSGAWSMGDEAGSHEMAIVSVAYISNEEAPGLWVEAFPFKPDISDVVSRIMEEFQREGTLSGVSAEQFREMAKPNIVILDQREIQEMLAQFERESSLKGPAKAEEVKVDFESVEEVLDQDST